MKQHTTVGFDLLKNLEMYSEAAQLVKYEHERWDGTGYPDGLKGEQIPSVLESFTLLTSTMRLPATDPTANPRGCRDTTNPSKPCASSRARAATSSTPRSSKRSCASSPMN